MRAYGHRAGLARMGSSARDVAVAGAAVAAGARAAGSWVWVDDDAAAALLSLAPLAEWAALPYNYRGWRAVDMEEDADDQGTESDEEGDDDPVASVVFFVAGAEWVPGEWPVAQRLARCLTQRVPNALERAAQRAAEAGAAVRVTVLVTWTNEDAERYGGADGVDADAEEANDDDGALPYAHMKAQLEAALAQAWKRRLSRASRQRRDLAAHVEWSAWVYYAPFLAGVSLVATQRFLSVPAAGRSWTNCLAFPADRPALEARLRGHHRAARDDTTWALLTFARHLAAVCVTLGYVCDGVFAPSNGVAAAALSDRFAQLFECARAEFADTLAEASLLPFGERNVEPVQKSDDVERHVTVLLVDRLSDMDTAVRHPHGHDPRSTDWYAPVLRGQSTASMACVEAALATDTDVTPPDTGAAGLLPDTASTRLLLASESFSRQVLPLQTDVKGFLRYAHDQLQQCLDGEASVPRGGASKRVVAVARRSKLGATRTSTPTVTTPSLDEATRIAHTQALLERAAHKMPLTTRWRHVTLLHLTRVAVAYEKRRSAETTSQPDAVDRQDAFAVETALPIYLDRLDALRANDGDIDAVSSVLQEALRTQPLRAVGLPLLLSAFAVFHFHEAPDELIARLRSALVQRAAAERDEWLQQTADPLFQRLADVARCTLRPTTTARTAVPATTNSNYDSVRMANTAAALLSGQQRGIDFYPVSAHSGPDLAGLLRTGLARVTGTTTASTPTAPPVLLVAVAGGLTITELRALQQLSQTPATSITTTTTTSVHRPQVLISASGSAPWVDRRAVLTACFGV
eukprot:ctg_2018.g551